MGLDDCNRMKVEELKNGEIKLYQKQLQYGDPVQFCDELLNVLQEPFQIEK